MSKLLCIDHYENDDKLYPFYRLDDTKVVFIRDGNNVKYPYRDNSKSYTKPIIHDLPLVLIDYKDASFVDALINKYSYRNDERPKFLLRYDAIVEAIEERHIDTFFNLLSSELNINVPAEDFSKFFDEFCSYMNSNTTVEKSMLDFLCLIVDKNPTYKAIRRDKIYDKDKLNKIIYKTDDVVIAYIDIGWYLYFNRIYGLSDSIIDLTDLNENLEDSELFDKKAVIMIIPKYYLIRPDINSIMSEDYFETELIEDINSDYFGANSSFSYNYKIIMLSANYLDILKIKRHEFVSGLIPLKKDKSGNLSIRFRVLKDIVETFNIAKSIENTGLYTITSLCNYYTFPLDCINKKYAYGTSDLIEADSFQFNVFKLCNMSSMLKYSTISLRQFDLYKTPDSFGFFLFLLCQAKTLGIYSRPEVNNLIDDSYNKLYDILIGNNYNDSYTKWKDEYVTYVVCEFYVIALIVSLIGYANKYSGKAYYARLLNTSKVTNIKDTSLIEFVLSSECVQGLKESLVLDTIFGKDYNVALNNSSVTDVTNSVSSKHILDILHNNLCYKIFKHQYDIDRKIADTNKDIYELKDDVWNVTDSYKDSMVAIDVVSRLNFFNLYFDTTCFEKLFKTCEYNKNDHSVKLVYDFEPLFGRDSALVINRLVLKKDNPQKVNLGKIWLNFAGKSFSNSSKYKFEIFKKYNRSKIDSIADFPDDYESFVVWMNLKNKSYYGVKTILGALNQDVLELQQITEKETFISRRNKDENSTVAEEELVGKYNLRLRFDYFSEKHLLKSGYPYLFDLLPKLDEIVSYINPYAFEAPLIEMFWMQLGHPKIHIDRFSVSDIVLSIEYNCLVVDAKGLLT